MASILTAAAELFARQGYAGATTNRIAERAGVSIGSLYQYFPNKDALLAGLMKRHLEGVHAVVERSMAEFDDVEVPLRAALRSLLVRLVELHEADPQLTQALSREGFHLHRDAKEHGAGEHSYAGRMEQVLRRRPGVRGGDLTLTAHVMVQTVEALSRWLVHDAPDGLDKRDAIEEIVQLLVSHVEK